MPKYKKRKVKYSQPEKPQTKKLPKALFYPAGVSDGCTAWRFEFPKTALNYTKHSDIQITNLMQPLYKPDKTISDVYLKMDAVVMQRPILSEQINIAHHFNIIQQSLRNNRLKPFRFVIDVDDVVHGDYVGKYNVMGEHFFDNKRFENFKEVVKRANELQVCSSYMRDFYKEELGVDHVTYRPNLMPRYLYDNFDLDRSLDRYDINVNLNKKPRILWAGSASHIDVKNLNNGEDDFTHIIDFIRSTVDEYQWVFFGGAPNGLIDLKEKIEFHNWVGIFNYPQKIHSLNVDCMIAPLQDNVFNRAKSNIKITEAGALGIPCICQDLEPYKEAPLRFNTSDELADQIKHVLDDEGVYQDVLLKQKEVSDQYFIDDPENILMLMAGYYLPLGTEQRRKLSPKLKELNE